MGEIAEDSIHWEGADFDDEEDEEEEQSGD
jgi:hypothetical protein